MENRSVVTPADSSSNTSARPVAARTRMLLEAPIVPTLLRLAAPNVLNLLAFVGLITFDGLFVGRLGPDALAGISLVFPWVMLMQHGAASGMGGAGSCSPRAGASSRCSGWTLARRGFLRRLQWDSWPMPGLRALHCHESRSPPRRKEAAHENKGESHA